VGEPPISVEEMPQDQAGNPVLVDAWGQDEMTPSGLGNTILCLARAPLKSTVTCWYDLAGWCYEDRVALNYLLGRPEVDTKNVGCIGLSGGGNRSALLLATHEGIRAAVIVGLMSTYADLLDHNVYSHTWMLFPHGWARYGDWPDIAACRAPLPLLVQYDQEDELFTGGMQNAHQRLKAHYQNSGHLEAYTGQFYPGYHKFDLDMQAAAFTWLKQTLRLG
jgi:dienelactone hydrolase